MLNARKKLILGILERTGQQHLGFNYSATTADAALYRTVVFKTGLYRQNDANWDWATPEELNDRALAAVWSQIQSFFLDPGVGKTPATLIESLKSPPYGVRQGVIPILISAGLRRFSRVISFRRHGKYVSDILASEIEELCERPHEFTFDVLDSNKEVVAYLGNLVEQFGGDSTASNKNELLRQFYDVLNAWKSRLPDSALTTRSVSKSTQEFQAVLREFNEPDVIAFEMFLQFDNNSKRCFTTAMQQVSRARQELENIIDSYTRKAIQIVRSNLSISDSDECDTLVSAHQWSECFANCRESSSIGPVERAVLARSSDAHNGRYTEASFSWALSTILLGKGLDQWNDYSVLQFERSLRETVNRMEQSVLDDIHLNAAAVPLVERRIGSMFTKLKEATSAEHAEGLLKKLAATNELN